MLTFYHLNYPSICSSVFESDSNKGDCVYNVWRNTFKKRLFLFVWGILLKRQFLFICVCVCKREKERACMHMCVLTWVQVPIEARKGCWNLWPWRLWLLGIILWCSARAVHILWAISQALGNTFLKMGTVAWQLSFLTFFFLCAMLFFFCDSKMPLDSRPLDCVLCCIYFP